MNTVDMVSMEWNKIHDFQTSDDNNLVSKSMLAVNCANQVPTLPHIIIVRACT